MKHGSLFKTIAAILFSGLFLTLGPLSTGVFAGPDEAADKTPEYVAYYFYTSKRCGPCTRIEKWSRDAIKQNFKDEIDAGKLQWRAINVEKPDNKHFIQDFKLYTKSVIIAEYRNGEAVRWENLEKVWNLYQDKEKYFDYVAGQTSTFMESS